MFNLNNMEKKKVIKIKTILFELDGGGKHIAVKSTINGKKSVLLIDTGASNSIFDIDNKAFAEVSFSAVNGEGSGSGFNSEIPELSKGVINSLNIGRFKIENENVIFTSMDHINKLYKSLRLPRIAGILGSDFLIKYAAIIDFGQSILLLNKN